MRSYLLPVILAGLLHGQSLNAQNEVPSPNVLQLDWQKMGTTEFLHFSVNTFTGKEWGTGVVEYGVLRLSDP